MIPIGVDLDVPVGEEGGIEAILSFERKLRECRDKGIVVRAIMLCNPHNPLGEYFSSLLWFRVAAERLFRLLLPQGDVVGLRKIRSEIRSSSHQRRDLRSLCLQD